MQECKMIQRIGIGWRIKVCASYRLGIFSVRANVDNGIFATVNCTRSKAIKIIWFWDRVVKV